MKPSQTIVYLNNEFVPEERALVSAFDRGFLYGDGVFETVRVANGKLFLWKQHLARLQRGLEYLKIAMPATPPSLVGPPRRGGREPAVSAKPPYRTEGLRRPCLSEGWLGIALQLIQNNRLAEGVVRMVVTRGPGVRGYSPRGASTPTVVLSAHPLPPMALACPPQWRLVTASARLQVNDPLSKFKTCNKLPQVLARAEADATNADEALLLNTEGCAATGSASNLFWIEGNGVFTVPEISGALPGVTRRLVLELCRQQGIPCREEAATRDRLLASDGMFLTQSSTGIAEAIMLDGKALRRSAFLGRIGGAIAARLAKA